MKTKNFTKSFKIGDHVQKVEGTHAYKNNSATEGVGVITKITDEKSFPISVRFSTRTGNYIFKPSELEHYKTETYEIY